jgi:hypothetical protein
MLLELARQIFFELARNHDKDGVQLPIAQKIVKHSQLGHLRNLNSRTALSLANRQRLQTVGKKETYVTRGSDC